MILQYLQYLAPSFVPCFRMVSRSSMVMESLSGSPPDWLGVRANLPDSLRRFVSILRQSWVSSQSNESIITSSNVRASRSSALGFTDRLRRSAGRSKTDKENRPSENWKSFRHLSVRLPPAKKGACSWPIGPASFCPSDDWHHSWLLLFGFPVHKKSAHSRQ